MSTEHHCYGGCNGTGQPPGCKIASPDTLRLILENYPEATNFGRVGFMYLEREHPQTPYSQQSTVGTPYS